MSITLNQRTALEELNSVVREWEACDMPHTSVYEASKRVLEEFGVVMPQSQVEVNYLEELYER